MRKKILLGASVLLAVLVLCSCACVPFLMLSQVMDEQPRRGGAGNYDYGDLYDGDDYGGPYDEDDYGDYDDPYGEDERAGEYAAPGYDPYGGDPDYLPYADPYYAAFWELDEQDVANDPNFELWEEYDISEGIRTYVSYNDTLYPGSAVTLEFNDEAGGLFSVRNSVGTDMGVSIEPNELADLYESICEELRSSLGEASYEGEYFEEPGNMDENGEIAGEGDSYNRAHFLESLTTAGYYTASVGYKLDWLVVDCGIYSYDSGDYSIKLTYIDWD